MLSYLATGRKEHMMANSNINFEITEYQDGTYRIETHHIHYHFADGLLRDDVKPLDLIEAMTDITNICNNRYKVGATFTIA